MFSEHEANTGWRQLRQSRKPGAELNESIRPQRGKDLARPPASGRSHRGIFFTRRSTAYCMAQVLYKCHISLVSASGAGLHIGAMMSAHEEDSLCLHRPQGSKTQRQSALRGRYIDHAYYYDTTSHPRREPLHSRPYNISDCGLGLAGVL
jgi:hypothetical protein